MQFPKISEEQLRAAEAAAAVDESLVREALVRIPSSWTVAGLTPCGGYFRRGSIQVGISVLRYGDRRVWLHVSACGIRGHKPSFLPEWEDLKRVKNDFIGEDKWAYQVFPSAKHYVNQNPYVLHMFALFENEPALPDFTMGLGTL